MKKLNLYFVFSFLFFISFQNQGHCGSIARDSKPIYQLKPYWAEFPTLNWKNNCSFVGLNTDVNQKWDNFDVLDGESISRLQQEYQVSLKNFDEMEKFHLMNEKNRRDYLEFGQGYGKKLVNEIKNYQSNKGLNKAKDLVKRNPALQAFQSPVAIIAGTANYLYRGKAVEIPLSESLLLKTRAVVPEQMTEMELMGHGGLSSSLKWDNKVQSNSEYEKYKFSISKKYFTKKLVTTFSYGATSRSISAYVEKNLTDTLKLSFLSKKLVDDTSIPVYPLESIFQLKYEIYL